jgi:hypothetical protein
MVVALNYGVTGTKKLTVRATMALIATVTVTVTAFVSISAASHLCIHEWTNPFYCLSWLLIAARFIYTETYFYDLFVIWDGF